MREDVDLTSDDEDELSGDESAQETISEKLKRSDARRRIDDILAERQLKQSLKDDYDF